MKKALTADATYFPAASYLAWMYHGRAQLHCLEPAEQTADLRLADESQQKFKDHLPKSAKLASPQPADGVAWQGVNPLGMPAGGVLSGMIPPTSNSNSANTASVQVPDSISQGLLISQVQPVYPPLARQARIQGVVVLKAVIGKDGSIQELNLVNGHPMLAPAAMEAVKQWRYKPYYLNGEVVEVQTTINVNFSLQ